MTMNKYPLKDIQVVLAIANHEDIVTLEVGENKFSLNLQGQCDFLNGCQHILSNIHNVYSTPEFRIWGRREDGMEVIFISLEVDGKKQRHLLKRKNLLEMVEVLRQKLL